MNQFVVFRGELIPLLSDPEERNPYMTALTLLVGAVLTLAGVAGYALSGAASLTALIPSAIGVLLLICGLLARNAKMHRHAIHAGLLIALLGVLGSLRNVAGIGEVLAGTAERPAAVILSTVMFLVLALYLALGIGSFIKARRPKAAPGR
ncbi:hypothetical protein [Kocuria turfanensis]|uniref:Uncharacterized protein n=1 Tax=Kocuria turfanensis TaxID=388357 RepID=A0A512II98_9MICC|nr:hypothetical protein [Kocuria turfanensis]GEO97435.1 hypothetical protein KTU01_35580 [Kocuria turfanensis]